MLRAGPSSRPWLVCISRPTVAIPRKVSPSWPSDRQLAKNLAHVGGAEVETTLGHVGSAHGSSCDDDDSEHTYSYTVGSAASDGPRFRILRPHAKGA